MILEKYLLKYSCLPKMCAVKDAYTICVRCLGVHTKPFIFVKNNAFIQGLSHNLIIFCRAVKIKPVLLTMKFLCLQA